MAARRVLLLTLAGVWPRAATATTVETTCVSIDVSGSSHYQVNGGEEHFAFKFIVPQWVPDMIVRISFGEPVMVENVHQGAQLVEQYYYDGEVSEDTVVVKLDEKPSNPAASEFLIMGTGTSNMAPTITCSGNGVPPPSPPHPSDCELGPHYHVMQNWQTGEQAELSFDTWEEHRMVHLQYWSESVEVQLSGGAATVATRVFADGVTTVTLQLGSTHGVGADALVHLQISPPAYHMPKIVCHEDWLPPPPPPPPRSPPPSPPPPHLPPPPPPLKIQADYECALGGTAMILDSHSTEAQRRWMRVRVEPDKWEAGFVMVTGVQGSGLVVHSVTHASLDDSGGSVVHGVSLYAFVLLGSAVTGSFEFEVEGHDASLASLTCRLPSPPPPESSYTYIDDEYAGSYDDSDSYEVEEPVPLDMSGPRVVKQPSNALDSTLTAVLVLLVLAIIGCAAYQAREDIMHYVDRLTATSSLARKLRNQLSNLLPPGASEAETSVFDDQPQDELNDAAQDAARQRSRRARRRKGTRVADEEEEEEEFEECEPMGEPEPDPEDPLPAVSNESSHGVEAEFASYPLAVQGGRDMVVREPYREAD